MEATPFLMFRSDAREALRLWREAFAGPGMLDMQEYAARSQADQFAVACVGLGAGERRLFDRPSVHALPSPPRPRSSTAMEKPRYANWPARALQTAKK
jgi:hypothetical protein